MRGDADETATALSGDGHDPYGIVVFTAPPYAETPVLSLSKQKVTRRTAALPFATVKQPSGGVE
jgi:hypothetical protein